MNSEAIIVVLSCFLILSWGLLILLFFLVRDFAKGATDAITGLKYIIDNITEIINDRHPYDEGKDEERN